MSQRMTPVKVETWTVKELIDATLTNPTLGRQLTIPGFQRRLAWPEEKRKGLITSIKNGYPFGSLLLFRDKVASNKSDKPKDYYKLIDGLQRTQALKYYDRNPNKFFDSSNVDEEDVRFIAKKLCRTSGNDNSAVRDTLVTWVQRKSGFSVLDGWETSDLVKALVANVLDLDVQSPEFNMKRIKLLDDTDFINTLRGFLEKVSGSADISSAEIPVVVYAGDSSKLEKIFALLNTKGTPLTKYEIFAAEWLDKLGPIDRKDIRDAIWKKYEKLAAEGFTLDVAEQASTETARRERDYNLFEFLFGFGQRLPENFERLFKPIRDDKPNPVGFNLVCACLGLHVSDMKNLPDRVKHLDRSQLVSCIEDSIKCVDRALDSVLSVKEANISKHPIYHKEYQIISAIATAFQLGYAVHDLSVHANSQRLLEGFSKNILMYYLYDILIGDWSGSGDSTLHETVGSRRYVKSAPSKEMWVRALDVWFDKHIDEFRHDRRYVRQDKDAILILKYIYAHRLSLVENARTYHVEHLIPVKQLTRVMNKNHKWPINTIGNLAFLKRADNLRKGGKNYVEFRRHQLQNGRISECEFAEAIEKDNRQLLCESDWFPHPQDLNERTLESFLRQRFSHLKCEFIRVWEHSSHIES